MSKNAQSNDIFNHPRGLFILFFTELWERFSFYGMRAILVLYMVTSLDHANPGLGWDKADALSLYGWYTASVYILGLFGGYVADRFLGLKKSVFAGGVLLAIGHSILAIPTLLAFYAGLVLIVIGVGLLKPNISSMVGQLYGEKDLRRDSGFTIFYVGINIGAMCASLLVGYVGEVHGWHYGFGLAGIGMLIGLLVFLAGQKHIHHIGNHVKATTQNEKFSLGCLTADERNRLLLIGFACLINIIFFGAYEQAGGLTTIYTSEKINRVVMGFEIPASVFQALNPFFVMTLGTVVAALWLRFSAKREYSDTLFKMATGLGLAGIGFSCLSMATIEAASSANQKASLIWLVVSTLLITCGELSVVPVALSYVTKLAPPRFTALAMGAFFFCIGVGNKLAGFVGGLAEGLGDFQTFTSIAAVCFGVGLLVGILRRPLSNLAPGVDR